MFSVKCITHSNITFLRVVESMKSSISKRGRLLCLFMTLCLLLSACGAEQTAPQAPDGSGYSDAGKTAGYDRDNSAEFEPAPPADAPMAPATDLPLIPPGGDRVITENRKFIKNANFTMQTLEFDSTLARLETLAAEMGGFIQSSNVSGQSIKTDYPGARYASFTLRIPASGLDDFGERVKELGNITAQSENIQDVSDYYYDTEARLKTLRTEEERLLEILKKAENLSDILTIESALSNVRYQIESMDGQMRRLEDQITYSTIYLNVEEVLDSSKLVVSPLTLGQRISERFASSIKGIKTFIENAIVFVAGDILVIALWGIVLFGLFVVGKRYFKTRNASPKLTEEGKSDENK